MTLCCRPPPGLGRSGAARAFGFDLKVSFASWVGGLLRAVLRTRTAFSSFLRSTLHLPRLPRPAPPSGTVFPLPLPFEDAFKRFSLDCSSRFRKRVMHRRLLHIVCMGLNFLYAGCVPIPLAALQRPPNAAQQRLVAHVGRRLKAFGASVSEFALPDSGRRNPQLIARLSELMAFLSASSANTGDAYAGLSGTAVPTHNDAFPGLEPFGSLNVSRLKLSGRGGWDPGPFLPDELYMAFLEPRSLLHGGPPPDDFVPVWTRERVEETAALASLWDSLGLLHLEPARLRASESYRLARAFNCYKSADKDRMIIDRRGQNFAESRLAGPSLFIPVGPMLGMIEADPSRERVLCSTTDRKDFYHQFAAGRPKASLNALGPALPAALLSHTSAYARLCAELRSSRESRLDCFSSRPADDVRNPLLFEEGSLLVCFKAIAQGDHLGVEVGSAAHSSLLESVGLLDEGQRLCSNRPFKGDRCAQGLVIDDYFSVSVHKAGDASEPACVDHVRRAKVAYRHAQLAGSDDKDVWGEPFAKIAGAEVNSSERACSLGLITLASPACKRLALATVSLEAARFSQISDSLMLSLLGSWTSSLLFRRPLMSVLQAVYEVVPHSSIKPGAPRLCAFSRAAAQELVLLSVLCPLAASELSAPLSPLIYATDASEHKGGYVVASVGLPLSRALWRTSSKKGGYSRLWSREEATLARFTDREVFDLRIAEARGAVVGPERPLAFYFDFIEVGLSHGAVSAHLAACGRRPGPIISFSCSPAYDLLSPRTLEWLLHLMRHQKLKSLLVLPPVSDFAAHCWPSWRSPAFPRGSPPQTRRTATSTALALRCLSLVFAALQFQVVCVLVQPGTSVMCHLPEWRRLVSLGASVYTTCPAPPGQCGGALQLLACGIDLSPLGRLCECAPLSVQPRRATSSLLTCLSPVLASALAHEFNCALRRVSHVDSQLRLQTGGLENLILNDVVLSLPWRDGDAWSWRSSAHINILETASILRLFKRLAGSGPSRVVVLVDSSVAFHACAKGRSPSRGLTPVLRKIGATCLASGLYPAFHFVPTRLNPGDCPTRDLPLPAPARFSFWAGLSQDELYEGLALPKMRRWAANWSRLVCLLVGPPPAFRPHLGWSVRRCTTRLFDSSLGFPGEGPFFRVFGVFLGLWVAAVASPSHGLRPRNAADQRRSRSRAATVLTEGRPVQPATQKRRDRLLQMFSDWLLQQGTSLTELLELEPHVTKRLNNWLVLYGRQLFEAGWPYSHFSEVINAVSGREPALRRSLQPAWNLAFTWLREEPHSHHVALPWQVLLAAITTALMWGWPRVAGVLALTFGALMRIGETSASRRGDLLLPEDVGNTVSYCLVSIQEPKTRFKAARHQSARLDQPDLLAVVRLAFSGLAFGCKLWPYSASTLRSRFDVIMARLGTDKWHGQGSSKLDLGSLRAGGATWLLQCSEDAELVRRRGRWLNSRTMEIYIQEISSLQFLHKLSSPARHLLFSLLESFPSVLYKASQLQASSTPTSAWFSQFSGGGA